MEISRDQHLDDAQETILKLARIIGECRNNADAPLPTLSYSYPTDSMGGTGTERSGLIRPIHKVRIEYKWIIPQVIPLRELTIVAGESDMAKSFLTQAIGTYITTGELRDYFPKSDIQEPRTVYYFTREDDEDTTLIGRALDHGYDPESERIKVLDSKLCFSDFPALEGDIIADRPAMVVWDTASMFLSPKVNMNEQNAVVQDLENLLDLARIYNFAVVVICHLRKAAGTLKERINASIGFTSLARSVVGVEWVNEEERIRCFSNVKLNIHERKIGHEFTIENNRVEFQLTSGDYSHLMRGKKNASPQSDQLLCNDWLGELIATGPILNDKVVKEANENGFDKSQLSRARKKHNAKVKRLQDGLYYTVPLIDGAMAVAVATP
jgi:hypothetical protein